MMTWAITSPNRTPSTNETLQYRNHQLPYVAFLSKHAVPNHLLPMRAGFRRFRQQASYTSLHLYSYDYDPFESAD